MPRAGLRSTTRRSGPRYLATRCAALRRAPSSRLTLIGALGLASYAVVVRRGREVTAQLQDALAGQKLPAPRIRDDFAAALEAADRVGQELNLERERGAQARQRLHTLSRLVDVGVLLVDPSRQLEFANPRACELLDCADPVELEGRWPEILPLLDPAGPMGEQLSQFDFEVPGSHQCACGALPGVPLGGGGAPGLPLSAA